MVPAIPENADQAEQMIFNPKAEHQDILGCVFLFFVCFYLQTGRRACLVCDTHASRSSCTSRQTADTQRRISATADARYRARHPENCGLLNPWKELLTLAAQQRRMNKWASLDHRSCSWRPSELFDGSCSVWMMNARHQPVSFKLAHHAGSVEMFGILRVPVQS